MKKLVLVLLGVILFTTNSFAQWVSKRVNDGFSPAYTIAYTHDGQNEYLKLEKDGNEIAFYIDGLYICDDPVNVDLLFVVNGVNKLYQTWGHVSSDHERVFMVPNILSDSLMVADFKAASKLKVRVYDHVCSTETHEFSMSGSTAAFNAVLNQK
jgi:hypothetical protein